MGKGFEGIDTDIKDIFMGHAGRQAKTYIGKTREELEIYYELVEPKITIQIEETDDTEQLQNLSQELTEVKKQHKKEIDNAIDYVINSVPEDRIERIVEKLVKKYGLVENS